MTVLYHMLESMFFIFRSFRKDYLAVSRNFCIFASIFSTHCKVFILDGAAREGRVFFLSLQVFVKE